MLKENFTVTVKRPKEQVFEALTDFTVFAKASEGKVRIERVPGRPPKGVGEAFWIKPSEEARKQFMGMEDVLCETTDWDPPRRCTRKFDIKDLPTVVGFTLEDAPEGTKLTVDLQMEPKSMMYKMLLPVLGKKIQSEKDKALAMLQDRLDSPA